MNNFIKDIITNFEKKYFVRFTPTKEFYKKIKTGQKLWKKFVKNEAQPNAEQIILIAQVFKVMPEDIVKFPTQLEIFRPEYQILKIECSKIEEIKEFAKNKLGNKQQEEFFNLFNFIKLEK